ncbi:hypothetical protein [Nocardioides sp. B-3]|uniref:hypothetical protein n=1 Tax=Nocardioides sp. B-3 TaxID=2895565 RepID=UPI002152C676|nr:hypothetical protein [Nocardioides sp. B-3]UUZ58042.1 hypothetical protein LP418_17230 [Nocardioides sp. B-3]
MRRTTLIAVTLALLVQPAAAAAPEGEARAGGDRLHEVMFVGNNWAGTATIVDAHTHKVLKRGIDRSPTGSRSSPTSAATRWTRPTT